MGISSSKLAVYVGLPTLTFFGCFYAYRKYVCQTYFKRLGIPGPKPHWLFGNLRELWAAEQRHLVMDAWAKEYGPFFGYYEGPIPVLMMTTTDAVEQVFVKQFHSFPGRKGFPAAPDPLEYPDMPFSNIATVWGDRWKRLRTIVNPGFSTGKLKAYMPLIAKSQDELVDVFDQMARSGETFDAFPHYQCLALDAISEIAFGLELNSVKNRGEGNPILPLFRTFISGIITNEPFIVKLIESIPEIAFIFQKLAILQMEFSAGIFGPIIKLIAISKQIIGQRRSDPSKRRNDLLQLMIDNMEAVQSTEGLKPLSENEVTSQVLQFFGAGTNTTAATLAFASYRLAIHPEVQEKLYQEIIKQLPDVSAHPDYDTVMSMSYLDYFIHEVIRLHPIGLIFLDRFAIEETEVCGIPVRPFSEFAKVSVWSIHQDEHLWGPVDPAVFHPERFSPDYPTTPSRPASAFLGFGFGPRTCVGMRLALFEMKLTLVNLLRRFRFIEPEGGYPNNQLPVAEAVFMFPKNGSPIRLESRR